ncbi:MAG: trigger factor [Patescibacteria group bacterium]
MDSKTVDDATRQLVVELNADDIKKYITRTERVVNEQTRIDGFRPGKIPQKKLKNHVGQEAILQQALAAAVRGSLDEAVASEQLDVAEVSNLHVRENGPEHLVYEVTMALFPHVTLPDFTTIKVERRKVEVTDAEVEQTLETLRQHRATFLPKESSVALGDRVEVDFAVRNNGGIVTGGESNNHPLIVGGKSFLPGFEDQLIGLRTGEEKDFTLRAPDDYFQKDIAGKELSVHVKINLVQTVQLPALDDAFAQKAGKFADLAQLRSNVHDGIAQEKGHKEQERIRLAILDAVIAHAPIKVPAKMVEEQLEVLLAGFDQQLHERGMELAPYLAHIGKTREQLRDDWRKDAEREAKIRLVIHTVGKQENIAVSDREIEEELAAVVQSLVLRQNLSPEQIDLGRVRQQVRQQALVEKVLDFIEKRCAV